MRANRWKGMETGVLVALLASACSDPTAARARLAPDAANASVEGGVGIAAFAIVDLGTAAFLLNSRGNGINFTGQMAGVSYNVTPTFDGRLTLWDAAGAHDFGVPAGFAAAYGNAINDFGDIVGNAESPNGRRGFVWTPAGGFSILTGPPGATDVQAWDIEANNLLVVGELTLGGSTHAYRWQVAGGYQDLHPAGYLSSHAESIAPNGRVTGWAVTAAGDEHAVMWSPAGAYIDLGVIPGGMHSRSYDVSSNSTNVGEAEDAAGAVVAMSRRPPAAMSGAPLVDSRAMGISDLSRVVGWAPFGANAFRRAISRRGVTAFSFLPKLAGTMLSEANEVNRCGTVVGSTTFANGFTHATRWVKSPCD